MTSSGLQDVAANANPFVANEDVTRHFAMWLITNVSKGIRKPLPMTNAEVRALASNVALESVEMLQALIVSLIKALSGTRNPFFELAVGTDRLDRVYSRGQARLDSGAYILLLCFGGQIRCVTVACACLLWLPIMRPMSSGVQVAWALHSVQMT